MQRHLASRPTTLDDHLLICPDECACAAADLHAVSLVVWAGRSADFVQDYKVSLTIRLLDVERLISQSKCTTTDNLERAAESQCSDSPAHTYISLHPG